MTERLLKSTLNLQLVYSINIVTNLPTLRSVGNDWPNAERILHPKAFYGDYSCRAIQREIAIYLQSRSSKSITVNRADIDPTSADCVCVYVDGTGHRYRSCYALISTTISNTFITLPISFHNNQRSVIHFYYRASSPNPNSD
uniref:Uncharacterized protein n=1 Tax=Spongospora subterranea TaxID=70186 RepID=A0A0H5RCA4_9EUKA|eukprot:CRZ11376.1 hypothetical protein [Spongospora subterranea]